MSHTNPWAKGLTGLAVLAIAVVPAPSDFHRPTERTFRIEVDRSAYTPAVVAVNPGDRVTIELVAADVVHGLHIDGYDLSVSADPGQPGRLTFIADRPGTFRFRCSVTCGPLHPFVIGKLKVGQNWLLWRAVALAVVVSFGAALVIRR